MVTADSLATASQIRQQHDNSLGLKLLVARLYLLQVNTLPRALNPRVRCAFCNVCNVFNVRELFNAIYVDNQKCSNQTLLW